MDAIIKKETRTRLSDKNTIAQIGESLRAVAKDSEAKLVENSLKTLESRIEAWKAFSDNFDETFANFDGAENAKTLREKALFDWKLDAKKKPSNLTADNGVHGSEAGFTIPIPFIQGNSLGDPRALSEKTRVAFLREMGALESGQTLEGIFQPSGSPNPLDELTMHGTKQNLGVRELPTSLDGITIFIQAKHPNLIQMRFTPETLEASFSNSSS